MMPYEVIDGRIYDIVTGDEIRVPKSCECDERGLCPRLECHQRHEAEKRYYQPMSAR